MIITASDGAFESSITIYITVEIINNNQPIITLSTSTVTFIENSVTPLPIGNRFQPDITDADNNAVFLMESATVMLLDVLDGNSEVIAVPSDAANGLAMLGITVQGTY